MRFAPAGVHRKPAGEERPALWYVIWLGPPETEGSVILGRVKRLRRHLWYRAFPEDGSACQEIKGLVTAQEWLLGIHRQKAAAPD